MLSMRFACCLLCCLTITIVQPVFAQSSGNRLLGLDVAAWQGNISQTTWDNIRNVENRRFVFIRSSRGGTTGEDRRQGGYPASDNDFFNLSQRYDDPYYIQNINRATAAGMYAGSYHFSRPDVIATTTNSGGIANTGTDEANHFLQMAGAFMRPGYLPPVHDLEAGDGLRTDSQMAQFALDFSDRIYQVMGIRPAIYVNGNYASSVLGNATAAQRSLLAQQSPIAPNPAGPAYSQLWTARWPNQANPDAIQVQTAHPSDSVSTVYGPWDDYGVAQPWVFWQYASTGRLQSFNSGGQNLDFNVVQGGEEYLKDQLIPAVWMNDSSGDWNTFANWNSGQTPVAPISSPGQLTPFATGPLPTPRLPGAAGTGPTAGSNDTVILDRPNASITVSLSSGTHNIRKLYVREAFNINGGALNVNYTPVAESTPMSAKFSAPVSLSVGGSLSLHTLHVDPAVDLNANVATLTFDTLTLMRGPTPARFVLSGDTILAGLNGSTAKIITDIGAASSGVVDLAGGVRAVNVINGTAAVDLDIFVPVVNGGLTKSGPGTIALNNASTYTGGTIILGGTLIAANTAGSATGTGSITANATSTLSGTGFVANTVLIRDGATLSPGNPTTTAAPGTLTVNGTTPLVSMAAGSTLTFYQNTSLTPLPGSNAANAGTINNLLRVEGSFTLQNAQFLTVKLHGDAADFIPNQSYSFKVVETTNTIITFSVIDQNQFDTGSFANFSGQFSFNLTGSGNAVLLNIVPVSEPALAMILIGVFRFRRLQS